MRKILYGLLNLQKKIPWSVLGRNLMSEERIKSLLKQIFRDSGICLLLIVPMYTAEIDVEST